MKLKSILLVILLSLTSSTAVADEPKIEQGKIFFANGKIVRYATSQILHTDPEEALIEEEPVSKSEEPILIDAWKRLIIKKVFNLYEGNSTEITILDYDGNILNTSTKFMGTALFLINTKRIFLAQRSSHFIITESLMLNSDGKLIKEVPQDPNVVEFGHSSDGKVIWIFSSSGIGGKPKTKIKIIDHNGKVIRSEESEKEEQILFNFEGTRYEFRVPAPNWPG